jgi:predicted ATPase
VRIGFTGSQGTGKTTLAENSVDKIRLLKGDWKTVPSTARAAREAGYSINRDADPLSQILTTVARINAENKLADSGFSVLSDRTPIDSLAYTSYSFNNIWKNSNKFYWQQSADLASHHMKSYDAVFYFPVYWGPDADGVRDTDPHWQIEIDHMIIALLEDFGIYSIVVPNLSIEDRVEWFVNHAVFL